MFGEYLFICFLSLLPYKWAIFIICIGKPSIPRWWCLGCHEMCLWLKHQLASTFEWWVSCVISKLATMFDEFCCMIVHGLLTFFLILVTRLSLLNRRKNNISREFNALLKLRGYYCQPNCLYICITRCRLSLCLKSCSLTAFFLNILLYDTRAFCLYLQYSAQMLYVGISLLMYAWHPLHI